MRSGFQYFLTTVMSCFFLMSPALAANVRDIRVEGSERVEPATVLTYLGLHKGDEVTQDALDQSLKSLFATGLFADVQISESSGVVIVKIVENPVLNQIAFEGNDELEDEQLLSEITARPRQVFTRTSVQNDVTRLYDIYQRNGRFSADIQPKVIKLDQNRVNLVFEISEGPLTEISSIRFVGNERFSDNELRSVITSKERRWYNILSSADRYDQDRLSYDLELLRQFYLKEGYADFRVSSSLSELSQDREKFYVTVTVDEGERYKVGDIRVNSQLRNLDPQVLMKDVTLNASDWYDAEEVKNTVEKMTHSLGDMQYAFADVVPDVARNRQQKTIDLVFNINESPRVFVERINIDGNVRTLDKVVRRQMELVEGDAFNRTLLAESEKNVRDLGYFSKVDVKTLPGSAPDKTVVDVSVEEQSTGEISLGAGFSTVDGPLADFHIRERNLLGKGQDLGFSATIAGARTEFDISITEPYFLDRDLSLGFDAFHTTRDQQDQSSFDQRRTGTGVRLGYPLSDKWRQSWRYRIESNEIANVDSDASRFIQDQEGSRLTSAISQRLSYENLDSRLYPTDGVTAWLEAEMAGLGGDAQYVSGKLGGAYYVPIAKNWVFNLLGETGIIGAYGDSDIQINERYFLGGNTFRGFEKYGVGPRDLTTNDSLGGNQFYRGTAELTFPLGLPDDLGVSGHAFSDIGSLWGLDETGTGVVDDNLLRGSAGVGVTWISPMGPVRVDLSKPYLKEDYDVEQVFRFSFGTRF
ncbi:MAG: outer membrane protein assembly factor BamA [Alphaproteobacteria bacterium]|nr:outer membrane protein assembly factor BamA [Alphaproteobacteria bacterium]MCB1550950.1 outer membrane protein assembly factor BamA [Alphaproteobacteria bacterium]MCB9984871.1 outer membrane protein assembly factor BamA [Micavibrio sp.]HPQ50839.1 outer membrane protein assembly factor BamA [Alphaproteobacteria bacterium]HRK97263.1 outer membrane protein assembly factor BamA [Alphaproteobacteria bacterium]